MNHRPKLNKTRLLSRKHFMSKLNEGINIHGHFLHTKKRKVFEITNRGGNERWKIRDQVFLSHIQIYLFYAYSVRKNRNEKKKIVLGRRWRWRTNSIFTKNANFLTID